MLQLNLDEDAVDEIINYGLLLDADDDSRVWIAAASPGWPLDLTRRFLNECITSKNQQVKRAADAAIKNNFLKWSPL